MTADLSPHDILRSMRETYAKCHSYQDSGCVRTTFPGSTTISGGLETKQPFMTAFVRPDRFRFEFQNTDSDPWRRYIVFQSGSMACSWWDVQPGIKELDCLSRGLAGATGVSGGSARTIPAFLMPECGLGVPFDNLKDLKRLPDSKVHGTDCFSIEGYYEFDHPAKSFTHGDQKIEVEAMKGSGSERLWIEKSSFLLLRIERRHSINDFSGIETITIYRPTINEFVPEDDLKFDPPLHT